jgi:hypothetical protein
MVNNTVDNHLYDWWIDSTNKLQGIDLGAHWSNVQLFAVGQFDNKTTNTEFLVQSTVDYHIYEWWITPQGQLTGIDLGLEAGVQPIGTGKYKASIANDQLLVRNSSDGHFYQ